jgi:hypothetical protein
MWGMNTVPNIDLGRLIYSKPYRVAISSPPIRLEDPVKSSFDSHDFFGDDDKSLTFNNVFKTTPG